MNFFYKEPKGLKSAMMTNNPVTGHIQSFMHSNEIMSELSFADSMLKINTQ